MTRLPESQTVRSTSLFRRNTEVQSQCQQPAATTVDVSVDSRTSRSPTKVPRPALSNRGMAFNTGLEAARSGSPASGLADRQSVYPGPLVQMGAALRSSRRLIGLTRFLSPLRRMSSCAVIL